MATPSRIKHVGVLLSVFAYGLTANAGSGSHVSLALKDTKATIDGQSLAWFDANTRGFTVYTFTGNTAPHPTCDNVTLVVAGMSAGTLISLSVLNFLGKPGKYNLGGVVYAKALPGGGELTMDSLSASTIDIKTFVEGKSMTAQITTSPSSATTVSGSISAKVCPLKR